MQAFFCPMGLHIQITLFFKVLKLYPLVLLMRVVLRWNCLCSIGGVRNCERANLLGKYFFRTVTYETFAVWTSRKAFLTDALWQDERCVAHLRSLKFDILPHTDRRPYPVCGGAAELPQFSIVTSVGCEKGITSVSAPKRPNRLWCPPSLIFSAYRG